MSWVMILKLTYHKMQKILCFSILFALLCSCSTIKEVPINHIDKIEYRDSVVYIHDTVSVPVPYEVTKEVIPDIDTSYLETSIAKSVAYLDKDKKKLSHTLEQKGNLKAKIDTFVVVEYVDRYIEKEVPITVEVEKPYIPQWCWWSLIFNVIIASFIAIRAYLKLKGL